MHSTYGDVTATLLVLRPRVDPVKQAVQRLARKDLLFFAAAVRSRICLGKPNRQKDTLNDAQNDAQQDGFAQIVEKHIQEFQPYFQRTGVMRCFFVACLCPACMHVIVAQAPLPYNSRADCTQNNS